MEKSLRFATTVAVNVGAAPREPEWTGHKRKMTDQSTVLRLRLPDTATELPPNAPRSIGSYRLVARLGSGGMGVVFAGVGPNGDAVAVKTVHGDLAADPEFRARFAREVELLRRVGGTCVVPLLDTDVRARRPWLVTPPAGRCRSSAGPCC